MSGGLSIREENLGSSIRVYLTGEVDIYTSQKLKERLYNIIDSNQLDLTINCKDLSYIDSTGLGIFVGALKKAKQNEKNIYISGLRENIKKLFLITGLDKLFIIEEWKDEYNGR